jgi:DNA replication initiation complex subunit (GINS family)
MKSKINALEKMVDQINADLSSNKETVRARYEKIKSDFRQLIRDLSA